MTEHKDRKLREFSLRLRKAADYRGLPDHGKASIIADEFEKRGITLTGMSVGRWFKASTLPSSSNMQILAEILNVQAEWLITGKGPMVLTEARDSEGELRKVVVNELPLLTQDQVAAFLNREIEPPRTVLVSGMLSKSAFCYRLSNQSLAPKIAAGTLLVIDPDYSQDVGTPLMAIHNDVVSFGYPVRGQDGMILEPVNTQYPIQTVPTSAIIGPVVALAQQFLTDTA